MSKEDLTPRQQKARELLAGIERGIASGKIPQNDIPRYQEQITKLRTIGGITPPAELPVEVHLADPVYPTSMKFQTPEKTSAGAARPWGWFELPEKADLPVLIMAKTLIKKEGCVIIPKNRLAFMSVPYPQALQGTVEVQDMPIVEKWTTILTRYPQLPAIADQFENSDTERDQWRKAMNRKYGPIFNEVYRLPNQLTISNLSTVTSALQILAMYVGKNPYAHELANTLKGKSAALRHAIKDTYTGKLVHGEEGKLAIVQLFQDEAMEALTLLYGRKNTKRLYIT